MFSEDQLAKEAVTHDFKNNDDHRRRILFTSIHGKLKSADLMLSAAVEAASLARQAYIQGDKATAKRNAEAVYAAIEEVSQSLAMVQTLSVKAGSDRSIPPMAKYQNAVALVDQPGTNNPPSSSNVSQ